MREKRWIFSPLLYPAGEVGARTATPSFLRKFRAPGQACPSTKDGHPPILVGKPPRKIEGTIEQLQILYSRDLNGAELDQMRRQPLSIEQGELSRPESLNQGRQRDLGSVGDMMKH